jgi:serine protease inhibitor
MLAMLQCFFSFKNSNHVCRERKFINLVISPFSINRALATLQEGSGKSSKTYAQLASFFSGKEPSTTIEQYAKDISHSESLKMTQVLVWCAGKVNPEYISQLGPHTKWLVMEQR